MAFDTKPPPDRNTPEPLLPEMVPWLMTVRAPSVWTPSIRPVMCAAAPLLVTVPPTLISTPLPFVAAMVPALVMMAAPTVTSTPLVPPEMRAVVVLFVIVPPATR